MYLEFEKMIPMFFLDVQICENKEKLDKNSEIFDTKKCVIKP